MIAISTGNPGSGSVFPHGASCPAGLSLAAPVCAPFPPVTEIRVPRAEYDRVIVDERCSSMLTTLAESFRSWRGTRFATLSTAPRYRSLSPSGKPQFRNIACEIARRRDDVFPDAFPYASRDGTLLACR